MEGLGRNPSGGTSLAPVANTRMFSKVAQLLPSKNIYKITSKEYCNDLITACYSTKLPISETFRLSLLSQSWSSNALWQSLLGLSVWSLPLNTKVRKCRPLLMRLEEIGHDKKPIPITLDGSALVTRHSNLPDLPWIAREQTELCQLQSNDTILPIASPDFRIAANHCYQLVQGNPIQRRNV